MNDLLLLSMMLGGPKYGYQIKLEAGWIMGQEALHNNLVYPTLKRFLEEGWVSKKAVPGDRGQTRQQYAITAEGRRQLIERLSEFSEDDAASENAFRLRVGLFQVLRPEVREHILAGREKRLQRRDEALAALQVNLELGKFGGEIVKYMRKQIELESEWIRHLRRLAKSIIAKTIIAKNN
jgi:DNA-binding PadR family transcriptional regulator